MAPEGMSMVNVVCPIALSFFSFVVLKKERDWASGTFPD
jgi:hypothetical protein